MKAPNFSLPDQTGKIHKLSDYKGKWVLVYFYPKDDTIGCTKEACSFRDVSSDFKKKEIFILGISKDSVESHQKFASKYNLNFPILSDESKEVIKAYNSWGKKKFIGKEFEGTLRNSYFVNPKGEIVKTYERVNPLSHAKKVLEFSTT